MISNQNIKIKSFVMVVLILLVGYLGIYKIVVKGEAELSYYHGAQIHYGGPASGKPSAFARIHNAQKARFGFAEERGIDRNIRVLLSRSARLTMKAQPAYQTDTCSDDGWDKAHLRVSGERVLYNKVLRTGVPSELTFQAYKGDELVVTVDNPAQRGCGGASITFYETNHIKHYPTAFAIGWAILALLLIAFRLPLHVAILGVSFNLLLLLVNKQMGISGLADLVIASYLSAIFCGIWLVILSVSKLRIFRVLMTTLLILSALALPVIFLGHLLAFEALPTVDTFHAILQSHKNQIIEFWSKILGPKYIVATAASLLLMIYGLNSLLAVEIKRRSAFLLGVCLILFAARDYSSIVDGSPMLRMTGSAVEAYFHELEAFQKLDKERTSNPNSIVADSELKNTSLIVVIGESASKAHMSAYGYPRITTPYADRLIADGEMIRFDSAYSNHTYSNPTVSRALTAASNYNGKRWSGEPSALSVANAASISTTWISNKLKFGPWDNVMSVIGDDAQRTIHINSKIGKNLVSNRFDGALVPLVEQALAADDSHKLIFVHLQGSHVDYSARYPKSQIRFKGRLEPNLVGSALNFPNFNVDVVNAYDNSIYYTDSVLKQIVELLKKQDNSAAMLYFSDHGENVFARKSHNAALFEYDMAAIPLMLWANKSWQQTYQTKWQNLIANINKVFTNDHIFETVLGLTGVTSSYTQSQNDLSSDEYVAEDAPSTLHGSKPLNTKENKDFWLAGNLDLFRNLNSPLSSAKGNSLGHAGQIAASGVESLSLRLVIDEFDQTIGLFALLPTRSQVLGIEDVINSLGHHKLQNLNLLIEPFKADRIDVLEQKIKALLLSTDAKVTLFFAPENLDQIGRFTNLTRVGVDLISTENKLTKSLLSSAKKLDLGKSTDSPLYVALLAHDYRQIKTMAEQSIHLGFIVDASSELSYQQPNGASRLLQQAYWSDPRLKQVLLNFESMFAN